VVDPVGRIWFSTMGGLSVVDPRAFQANSAPAMAHIEGVTADSSVMELQGAMRIPGGHQRITFNYSGLSFSVPERVRFRYRLDSFDSEWSQPVAVREVAYTNLGPGSYRFRVMASNSDGLWNGVESSIPFQIEPIFWQTWWFRLSCIIVSGLIILFLYRYRLHMLSEQLNVRFEERLAERTRIAQDLHDTLLQGFLSASMQLSVANDQLPSEWPAKRLVGRVLELMAQVLDEGRRAVSGLRAGGGSTVDLEQAFTRIPQEIGIEQTVDFRVIVDGKPQPLHPIIRDEVYRIGREALVNAFRHSSAKSIEIELEYVAKQLRIIVRDDGCGIDEKVLESGRDGHWGLSGMRGRADEIGAQLNLWSRVGSGTEVELSIPGHIAFQTGSSNPRLRRLAGLNR
jgi:signal transduction histidine kinase